VRDITHVRQAYDPRFVFAWPTAKYAVMSGASAAGTLVEIKIKQLERGGTKLSEEDRKKLYDEVKRRTTSRWTHAMVRPDVDRQDHRSGGDARGNHNGAGGGGADPEVPKFSVGVCRREGSCRISVVGCQGSPRLSGSLRLCNRLLSPVDRSGIIRVWDWTASNW